MSLWTNFHLRLVFRKSNKAKTFGLSCFWISLDLKLEYIYLFSYFLNQQTIICIMKTSSDIPDIPTNLYSLIQTKDYSSRYYINRHNHDKIQFGTFYAVEIYINLLRVLANFFFLRNTLFPHLQNCFSFQMFLYHDLLWTFVYLQDKHFYQKQMYSEFQD